MTPYLKQLAWDLGLTDEDVEFVGNLDRERDKTPHTKYTLEMAYRTADLAVFPSTGGEGFGRTVAEALSSGTLVVVTNINGYRTVVIKDGKQFAKMIEPGNPYNLALQMDETLNMPQKQKEELQI